jgi:hypothetical protein
MEKLIAAILSWLPRHVKFKQRVSNYGGAHNNGMHPTTLSAPLINLVSSVQVVSYRRAAGDVGR